MRKKQKEKEKDLVKGYIVTVNNHTYSIRFEGDQAVVNGKKYKIEVKEETPGTDAPFIKKSLPDEKSRAGQLETRSLNAPLPGVVVRIAVQVGDHVKEGETVLVLESMKMETDANSLINGTIKEIAVTKGTQVTGGQLLALIQ